MRLVKLSGLSGRYSRQPLTSLPSYEPRRYFFRTNRERTNRRASATKIIKINSKEYFLVVLEPNFEKLEVVVGIGFPQIVNDYLGFFTGSNSQKKLGIVNK